MVILREEEGNRDLCLTQLRPTLVLLSSVLYFTSHRDSELTQSKEFSQKHLNIWADIQGADKMSLTP